MRKSMKSMIALMLALVMILSMAAPAVPAFAVTDGDVITEEVSELTAAQVKAITPANVKAVSYSYSKIKVTWDEIEGMDGYVVYRADSKTGKFVKAYTAAPQDKVSYINTGRTTGKTYYYKIRGFKKVNGKTCYTKYSAVASTYARPGKVKLSGVYGKPYTLVNVTLDWKAVSGASGYEQQINIKRNGKWTGWKSAYYEEDGSKEPFKTYDWYLAMAKKQFPSGKVTVVSENGSKEISLKEYVSDFSSKTSADIGILQDDSIYKFRVRAYRKVNGKKVYGAWSDEYTMKDTLNMDEIMAELKAYTIRYAAKVMPTFEYEEYGEEKTPENSGYYNRGVLGHCSMYARQEDVIAFYKDEIKSYLDWGVSCGANDFGFLYVRKSKAGDREGVEWHLSGHTYYKFWMLY